MRFLADLMSQVRNESEKISEGGGTRKPSRTSTLRDASLHASGLSCWWTREHSSSWEFTPPMACMKSGAERRPPA